MKRLLWLLVIICLVTACALACGEETSAEPKTVFFGCYEQDNNVDNGPEPIEWLVLEERADSLLLISRYALDCLPFNEAKEDIQWNDSSLRGWLNGDFMAAAFTPNEHSAVLASMQDNSAESGHPEWLSNGSASEDRVFILDYRQIVRYFPTEGERRLIGTEYARSKGAMFMGITSAVIAETDWWLRSTGRMPYDGCYMDVLGRVGTKQVSDKLGIRPAIWLDRTADSSDYPYEAFTQAKAAFASGEYTRAAEIFATLGNYWNSVSENIDSRYAAACAAQDNGDWQSAITEFETLGDHLDCYQRCRVCRYEIAVGAQDNGDWDRAIELFTAAGQYEDSMNRLIECIGQKGQPVYYFSDTLVNAGKDTGYSNSKELTIDDPHFGWPMGRFFMTDFTRVNEDDGQPLFIKTLGDNITLWFYLKQNIDSLDGKPLLIVNDDNNGYDQYFGVPRTDFGKGTLIIRHTDYQNAQTEPQIYTDYFLAKATSGANTRVEINEEGDYEVALNYEIANNDVVQTFNKYQNYRVFLRFSVRNGNCMIFPFDVATGEELTNTAITENGFMLDLARSRYLDIDVCHSVLAEGAAGVIEDERFNRPARDGDRYTQEGIYRITVSNRYTGESMVKTLFVGTEELLNEYANLGFTAEHLAQ